MRSEAKQGEKDDWSETDSARQKENNLKVSRLGYFNQKFEILSIHPTACLNSRCEMFVSRNQHDKLLPTL